MVAPSSRALAPLACLLARAPVRADEADPSAASLTGKPIDSDQFTGRFQVYW